MLPVNRLYEFVRDHININYLNQDKTNIQYQGPYKKLQVAPNGKRGRYPEAATFRITGGEIIQGAMIGLHKLCQPHTCRTHPAPIQ